MTRVLCLVLPLIVFVFLVIFMWRGLSLDPQHLPSVHEGRPLPKFQLPLLYEGKGKQNLNKSWYLLNVWASWCQACRDEHSFLLQLKQEGVPIAGFNYKDDAGDATQWLQNIGNPYIKVWQDTTGRVAIDLGVYGAPETFLVNAQGIVLLRHVGALNFETWNTEFLPRIRTL